MRTGQRCCESREKDSIAGPQTLLEVRVRVRNVAGSGELRRVRVSDVAGIAVAAISARLGSGGGPATPVYPSPRHAQQQRRASDAAIPAVRGQRCRRACGRRRASQNGPRHRAR